MSTEGILELVGSVYDCALDPSGWPVVLEGIAGLVDGINASISVQDPMRRQLLAGPLALADDAVRGVLANIIAPLLGSKGPCTSADPSRTCRTQRSP